MKNFFALLRPKHWTKNLFVLAAPFFGGQLANRDVLLGLPVAFACFSLCAGAVYILNDLKDLKQDRLHPEKKKRPLASGKILKKDAVFVMGILFLVSLGASFFISFSFFCWVFLYAFIQTAYSFSLKHVPLIDIFCIAAGFIIRIFAGGAAFEIEVSSWLFITMLMISLMLAAGKRGSETALLQNRVTEHRRSLSRDFSSTLHEILLISSSTSLMAYSLYTVEQSPELIYTVPVVTFGLFRYLMLAKTGLGDPTSALTKDRCLGGTVLIWLTLV
ncbi:MAG: decaprenyl-phosphate phosphoribosyltransferase, partial [Nitrospinota bacterium]